jgi:dTDP-4-amino-4,6-dideoxygalactose transaminase
MNRQAAARRAQPAPTAPFVPFNDLSIQWLAIAEQARGDLEHVLLSGAFCLGPEVETFEREAAAYLGVADAIGVNSGTSALHLAMLAAGIGPGHDVIVPSHTFIASIWSVIYVGANPVLCDVDSETGTLDVGDAERRVTARTRAIVPVHLYGQPASMDAVSDLAKRHGLAVIEDAAQSFGARWNGCATGTIGQFGCYSFYPGKNLGAAGEAGLVVASDSAAAARIRALRNHGQVERYLHSEIGFNYRMDGLQAVVLRHKLRHVDRWTGRRRQLAGIYDRLLDGLPLDRPAVRHQDHVWHLYVIRTPQRDELRQYLQEAGVETGLHYPIPSHRQPCLSHLGSDPASLPQSERWASEGLSLPLFYGMTDTQAEYVTDAVRRFFTQ